MNNFTVIVVVAFILMMIKRLTKPYPFLRPVSPFEPRKDKRGDWWFGADRNNSFGYHRGMDIRVNGMYQVIVAPESGIISKVSNVYLGETKYKYIELWLDQPNEGIKIRFLYAMLSTELNVGDHVRRGEVIGETQDISLKYNDGIKSTMLPHLHIEVIENGQHINPSTFFGVDEKMEKLKA